MAACFNEFVLFFEIEIRVLNYLSSVDQTGDIFAYFLLSLHCGIYGLNRLSLTQEEKASAVCFGSW